MATKHGLPTNEEIESILLLVEAKRAVSASRIRAARLAAGLSAEEFGRAVGVKRTTVYDWEGGRVFPSSTHLPLVFDFMKRLEKIVESDEL